MPYAYVSIKNGPKIRVDCANIRNFDPNNYKKKKYYHINNDGNNVEGVILLVAETEKELIEQINEKRPPDPNGKFCESASELSDDGKIKKQQQSNMKQADDKKPKIREIVEARVKIIKDNSLKRKMEVESTETNNNLTKKPKPDNEMQIDKTLLQNIKKEKEPGVLLQKTSATNNHPLRSDCKGGTKVRGKPKPPKKPLSTVQKNTSATNNHTSTISKPQGKITSCEKPPTPKKPLSPGKKVFI